MHNSASYTAQASASTATRLTISEVIAEEQTYGVDLDGNGTIGDDVEQYIFLAANHPSLVLTQVGNYSLSFDEVLGVNTLGLPNLITTSGNPWIPTRSNSVTGVLAERSGSSQIISVIENSGSSFLLHTKNGSLRYKMVLFATASTTIAISIPSAQLAALETRKNIDLLADGVIGDPIKSIVVNGGVTPLDSDNDGFTDASVTAPSIVLTKSNAYGLDLSGQGRVGDTPTSLFLESSSGVNWTPTNNYSVIGGFISYDVNTSSQQTTSAFIYEQSGSGPTSVYKKWHFIQGSASGVATATSSVANTISLDDILTKARTWI